MSPHSEVHLTALRILAGEEDCTCNETNAAWCPQCGLTEPVGKASRGQQAWILAASMHRYSPYEAITDERQFVKALCDDASQFAWQAHKHVRAEAIWN